MTLTDFEAAHREMVCAEVQPTSLQQYTYAFKHAYAVIGGEIHLTKITRRDVDRIKARMVMSGKSEGTIAKTMKRLRAAFRRAVERGLLYKNPFDGHGARDGDPKPARIFELDEIERIINHAPTQWWRAFLRLAFSTGLRRDELLHLRWSDIDLDGELVRVRARKAGSFDVGGDSYPILPWSAKARSSHRSVPMSEEAALELRKLQAKSDQSSYLFLTLDRLRSIQDRVESGTLRTDAVVMNNTLRDFQRIQRAALGPDAELGTIHDIRKTFGTHAAHRVPMHVLQECMGHSTITTTATFYTKVRDEDAQAIRDLFQPKAKMAG